jgi:GTP-binding protein HflX
VINKSDVLGETQRRRIENLYPDALMVSALEGVGLEPLLERIAEALSRKLIVLSLAVPYDRGDIVAAAHRVGEVIGEKHDEDGTIIDVRVPVSELDRFVAFSR